MKKKVLVVSLFLAVMLFISIGQASAFVLPDTGQTLCYDSAGYVIDCAGTGQNGEYSINPMSYTDNGNGTVTDNNTGLIWQKYENASPYNWYQAAGVYNAAYNSSSQNVCGALNIGGYEDWRLPSESELISIVDYSIPYPGSTIKAAYFPNAYASYYWSSTSPASGLSYAYAVHFDYGLVLYYYKYANKMYVRCVRGEQYPPQRLVDNDDGTVTDNTTGLMWQQGESEYITWDSALSYCKGLPLGNYSDWRLPNVKELESLIDYTRYNPAIDTAFFPNAYASYYWSATTSNRYRDRAYFVSFDYSSVSFIHKVIYSMYARCVRGVNIVNPLRSLTVTLDPQAGGTITGSPTSLTCSGNICTGSFPQGTSVTLTANPNDGWYFDDWDEGKICYYQNPLSVVMDVDKNITAKFIWNDKIFLTAIEPDPLGNRTPLILIHGNNMETENQFGWKDYLREFKKDKSFQGHYKVYLFSWDSEESNVYNGLAMGYLIDNLPELQNKDLTILAHNRGGIIARYFMNQYMLKGGSHQGQLGGEKVKWLVTLATPHRGSPAADEIWGRFSFDYNHWDLTALSFCDVLLNKWLFKDNYRFLLWDDANNELTNEEVAWDSACGGNNYTAYLMSTATDLRKLNQNEMYYGKIIAFGSNNYNAKTVDTSYLQRLLRGNFDLESVFMQHPFLMQASRLIAEMPIIPNGYTDGSNGIKIDNSYRPFQANDGMVPLISALFLKPDSGKIFSVKKGGKLTFDYNALQSKCQINEMIIVNGLFDHSDFLESSRIISDVIQKLKGLNGS